MGKDADEEKGDDASHTLIYVSGVAALVLLAMLVYAVLDTAESSQRRDAPVTYAPAISTTTTSKKTSTTSRTTPRISTTDVNPGSSTSMSPSETTSEVVIPSETEYSTPTTTTTLTNPYATTSVPNAGRT
ncbi:hypothetical protein H7J51_07200 [Mycobacterium crocinum]|uniref:Uncharacterized protein n=1 Tax=Mycolicibacterium crocinum TaxID=388459 RepID=A0ABY3TME4_9MYCO|nr:hypothetical protein [Mycolicibacterium crocinum]MCV7215068.1 hypothetical protein [Mycolicibacterium crocinum]ULN42130.1 hypothetical protein MI149_03095 [Mycolicibacterium crocinum]